MYEINGTMAVFVLILITVWLAATVWGISEALKSRKRKWALVSLIPLAGPLYFYITAGQGTKTEKIASLVKNKWVVIALVIIILLGMYVRLVDYRWGYLRNIDSYVFYRWMDETVQNGGILPAHDSYQLAPNGFDRPMEWIYPYFYIGAYSYMLTANFVSITLEQFLIYFPPFLAILAAIPLYFIGKLLYDRKAGVLAAFIYTFDINNISRSLGGDPDSDAIVILVSMIAIASFIFVYKYSTTEKTLSKRLVLYSVLSGLVLWIWYSTWAGYWYVFWLITGLVMFKLIANIVQKKHFINGLKETKYVLAAFAICMAVSFALTFPSYGGTKLTSALTGPIEFQSIKGEDSQFPNVYVSVAELQQSGGPREIIERTSTIGGAGILISPFFLMLYALAYLLYSYYKKQQHLDTVLLLLVWFLGPFIATMIAIRFSILFSAPLALGSAIILSKIIRMTTGEDKSFGD